MSTSERGFTLLELLIALALAAVISLCIATVSNQAQLVYDATTSKVEVYQKFRYALADMQENLQSMALTADLEFFVDNLSEPNGHWDDGEELKDSASGPNIEGGRPGKYDEGAQIIERQYTLTRGSLEEEHDNFSIYFKSAVTIEGKLRLANVEYYLADPRALDEGGSGRVARDVEDNSKFVLLKVVRYVDINESNFYTSKLKVRKVVSELCQNVTDLRIEYFYDNLFDDRPGAFITPSEEKLGQVVRSEGEIERLNDGGLLKEFLYGGFYNFNRGVAHPAVRSARQARLEPVYFSVPGGKIKFSELGRGDKIYIWTDAGRGQFPSSEYTIFRNDNGRIYFDEEVDSSAWAGQQQGGLRFRAGYLPSALRISIRILNDKGKEPRTLSVEVHPFRKRTA